MEYTHEEGLYPNIYTFGRSLVEPTLEAAHVKRVCSIRIVEPTTETAHVFRADLEDSPGRPAEPR